MEKVRDRLVSNEKGITLVEVLASFALLSLVLLLATSIHIFSQKQAVNQKEEIQTQSNVRLAANILTRDIRKANDVRVPPSSDPNILNFEIEKANGTIERYRYVEDENILYKESQTSTFEPFITEIETFLIIPNRLNRTVSIKVDSLPQTKITVRNW